MIEVRDLTKSFDGFKALDGLNLSVPKGAVYGLVGPNGAGKSTFIRNLTGIYRPDKGSITVDGAPVYENPDVKKRMVYIPDDIFYYTQATINDMMSFYKDIYPNFNTERFEKLGEVFALDRRHQMRKLSKGMQKQAAFWIAISLMPEIIVMDEPVDGLDPVMRRQIWSILMNDVAERDVTVLVSSHNLRELEDVCDHVGIMNRGKMLVERSLEELQENIVKIQLVLPEGGKLPENINVLHSSFTGRLQQLILRGRAQELTNIIAAANPVYMDVLPLSLEEIFIYELGGADYEVKDILI